MWQEKNLLKKLITFSSFLIEIKIHFTYLTKIFSEDIINNPNNSRNSIWPKEWKLVYSPKNPELELLLSKTAELMFLEGVLGVKNSSEVERVMIKRDYLAGVVFDHEEVQISKYL